MTKRPYISMVSAVNVKVSFTYTCDRCGREREGTTKYIDIQHYSVDGVVEALKRMRGTAHDMPDGWVSYHGEKDNVYICPDCKGSK
jgi:KaiC/GvpD/RAD55 family RecA-like ATPase